MKHTEVYIDPRNRLHYSAFYVQGLWDVYGRTHVHYSIKPFLTLERKETKSFDHYMAFVICNGSETIKVLIDFRDMVDFEEDVYDWSDVYAKINISKGLNFNHYPKLLSIPPGFGVRIYNWPEVIYHCVVNFFKCRRRRLTSLLGHLYDYYSTQKFAWIKEYENRKQEQSGYVFLASTLWEHENCVQTTNPLRLAFMEACNSNPTVDFEGGFVVHGNCSDGYKKYILKTRYSRKDYLKRIKLSELVFNTPSVHNCHGWKLGEYLAMGKTIISTPISNTLPAELVDRQHIYIVNNPEDMTNAVQMLLSNKEQMNYLREQAALYYSLYAKPEIVIRNIIDKYKKLHQGYNL